MANKTLIFGILLILLGVTGYAVSGGASVTALIPAFFGAVFAALGVAARRDAIRKHVMHASAALALIGFAATVSGIATLVSILGGADGRLLAAASRSAMALLSLAYVGLAVQSFVAARRQRDLGGAA